MKAENIEQKINKELIVQSRFVEIEYEPIPGDESGYDVMWSFTVTSNNRVLHFDMDNSSHDIRLQSISIDGTRYQTRFARSQGDAVRHIASNDPLLIEALKHFQRVYMSKNLEIRWPAAGYRKIELQYLLSLKEPLSEDLGFDN